MSETEVQPVTIERGRYAIHEAPDGGWVIARALDTCETCQGCGCGEQADLIVVPGMVVKMAMSGRGLPSKIKGIMAHGDGT